MAENEIKWTEEQQKVIDLHDRDILVSAAAGSGKTAVLVERIVTMITREENPIDIDRLVVVTFTNMAAYEMRSRIMAAIEKKLELEPDNKRLARQLTLVHKAQITTIDSFCLNIVRSYFSTIDLDPSFRVADENELKLISTEVMSELLEKHYDKENEDKDSVVKYQDFINFIDCFAPQKTDDKIEEYIQKLYRFSQSYPWPKEWLNDCVKAYDCEDKVEFMNSTIITYLTNSLRQQIKGMAYDAEYACRLCGMDGGPAQYIDTITAEKEMLEELAGFNDLEDLIEKVSSVEFAKLPSKKVPDLDEKLKEQVKDLRDGYKKKIDTYKNDYFTDSVEQMVERNRYSKEHVKTLINLTLEYMDMFDAKKKDKKVINFNDMEHLALNILIEKKDGNKIYTDVARELAQRYDEILIDEYQDSNEVQEEILSAISKSILDPDKKDMFMVGDVKQSIYKFRLARPELFVKKYDTYKLWSEGDSLQQKIELHSNYRSRDNVLISTNDVFEGIMKRSLGGVEYDENAKLNPAAKFEEESYENPPRFNTTQVYTMDYVQNNNADAIYTEGKMISKIIIDLVNGTSGKKVWDKDKKEFRKVEFGDIVILLRTMKKWSDNISDALEDSNIPVYADTSRAYFMTVEIRTLLSLLSVIDNPRQDIEIAAVMKSYFGGFTDDEIIELRNKDKELPLFDALALSESEKAKKLIKLIDAYRDCAKYLEISRLIWKLSYDTGYYDYVGNMENGTARQTNINVLVEKARQYENTSYKGLFHFMQYIEKLKSYDIDFEGATIGGENTNAVRIMSIHKSKGLEFPIVIVAGMTKGFNTMDTKESIIIDPDFGIGIDYVNCDTYVKKPTFTKRAIANKMVMDILAEEQRILYVAMTRAKEMLIMTACAKDIDDMYSDWEMERDKDRYTYNDIASHKCYMDMVMPIALKNTSNGHFEVIRDLVVKDVMEVKYEGTIVEAKVEDTEAETEFEYPYALSNLPIKMSVSEIKHMGMDEDNEYAGKLDVEPVDSLKDKIVPTFMGGDNTNYSASLGTQYHNLMEHLDYNRIDNVEQIKQQIEECIEKGFLDKDLAKKIVPDKIIDFTLSDVGKGAKTAFDCGKLYRERQFMAGIKASDIFKDIFSDELIMVQGIIDMFYEEEDGIVLVDYKTDNVSMDKEGEEELVRRYAAQLEQYKMAIKMSLQKKVKAVYIYSFKLGKSIRL